MQVGAEHPDGVGALRAVPVADADGHGRQRAGIRTEPGDTLMILEPGQARHAKLRIDVCDDLADPAALPAHAADVKDAETSYLLALCPAELRTDELVASTYREDDRATAGHASQAAIVAQPACC